MDPKDGFVSACTSYNKDKVRKDSLDCDFVITNGNGFVKNINLKCADDTRKNATIFNYLNTIGKDRWSLQHAYGKYHTTLNTSEINGVYGEYKLSLDKVHYQYCDGKNWQQ